jgi:hypothetical protein
VHAIHRGASDVSERIEMKNMASNATQDAQTETGSVYYKNLVDSRNPKNEKAPPDIAGSTGRIKGVDTSSTISELNPDADVSSNVPTCEIYELT